MVAERTGHSEWAHLLEKTTHFVRSLAANAARLLRGRRVPVLLQLNIVECGAACLAMILNYYRRATQVAECTEQCGIGRDGVTAKDLVRAARFYGLRVRAFSVDPSRFKYLRLPAIAHWEFNHFIVVERWSRHRIDIVDPACGRRRMSPQEFEAGLTGVVLELGPCASFDASQRTQTSAWRNYLKSILATPSAIGLLLQVIAASICLMLFGVALPILTKVVVDLMLPRHLVGVSGTVGAALLSIAAAIAIATYLRGALLIYLQGRVDMQMMFGFLEHLLSLPFRYFQLRNSGDVLMRLASNATIREVLTGNTLSTVMDGALVAGYVAFLLAQSWALGLLTLGLGLAQGVLLLGTVARTRHLNQRNLAAQSASQSFLVEVLTGIASLKASGAEERVLDRWSNLFAGELNASLARGHFGAQIDATLSTLRVLSPLVLLWAGARMVANQGMPLGSMLAFVTLASAFLQPLSSLVANVQRLQLIGSHLERIAEVLNTAPEQIANHARDMGQPSGRIELRSVSFRYEPNCPFVLRDISLSIEPGKKIAVVGHTGSGKSTLARLLLGLYASTEGEILYDGVPITSLDMRALRGYYGVVLQESSLFSGSIRQNITFGRPGIGLDKVIRAAKIAEIHSEIAALPMGYETLVCESGSGFSGGQRQRIALARALCHEPSILLLDEATSQLDAITEASIERNFSELRCTRVVIAHRMSTVMNADKIIVLDDGRLVEIGSHAELVARGGRYATLYSSFSASGRDHHVAVPRPHSNSCCSLLSS